MKKLIAIMLSVISIVSLSACGGTKPTNSSNSSNDKKTENKQEVSANATDIDFWTFSDLHQDFYETMAAEWNKANPDEQINLKATTLPFNDMHNKLLIALQSGTGAPDMVDIEVTKFANFLKGEPQLLPLNDIIDPEIDNIVKSRVDIYSKDGNEYGLDFHVGAAVMFYNKEILDAAGVDYTKIITVDDYLAAAEKVKATGNIMTTVETRESWFVMPFIKSLGGDIVGDDGLPSIDSQPVITALTLFQDMLKDGTAVIAPGGGHHEEEYYGAMNDGAYASVSMPFWYMIRFTDYMPDLSGKLVIAPVPVFKEGDPRSVGLGGTGTAITNQCKNVDITKKFLAFAKLSEQGNIEIWNILGFDPIRPSVWSLPEVHDSKNKFTEYFLNNPFDVLISIKDEILPVNVSEYLPPTNDSMGTQVLSRVYDGMEDVASVVKDEQTRIKVN